MDGESVVLNLANENYYGPDEVSTDKWQVLIDSESIQEAYKNLTAEYYVEPDTLKNDMQCLIGD